MIINETITEFLAHVGVISLLIVIVIILFYLFNKIVDVRYYFKNNKRGIERIECKLDNIEETLNHCLSILEEDPTTNNEV